MKVVAEKTTTPDYGPRRLTVELTNVCNLHCSYCLRDEDALYHSPARFLSTELFARVAKQARESMGIEQVMFTGGEPTLHPGFARIVESVAALNLKCSFVTNGWHFDRVWPLLQRHRDTVTHVAFSLDGATREAHDRWRGEGSFERVVRAFSRCWASQFPFRVKVGIRRDTVPELEKLALFASRMGAAGLNFAHIMPTSTEIEDISALSLDERAEAEREIAMLARMLKMPVGIDVGYYNTDPVAPCSALSGVSANVNYRGQLSLCCNLSGFRGGEGEDDVIADLNNEDFATASTRLQSLAETQSERRFRVLEAFADEGSKPDLINGSPCLFCLNTFGKSPWSALPATASSRSLPVIS
ncbi:MAG: radical SAM protein [Acidobacteriota bacterium]